MHPLPDIWPKSFGRAQKIPRSALGRLDTLANLVTSDPVERFFVERSARLDRRARLRTMSTSEVIDTAVRVYQQLGWTFLKASVLPALLIVVAVAFVLDFVAPSLLTTKDASSLSTQYGEVVFALGLAILVGGPLVIIGVSATTTMVTNLVSDYMLGNVPSIDGAIRAAKRTVTTLIRVHFWEFLLACSGIIVAFGLSILSSTLDTVTGQENVLAGLVALLALLGFCAGGAIFLVVVSRHALAAPVAVIEGLGPRAAGTRSVELMRGRGPIVSGYGHVWSLYIVLFFLSLLIAAGLSGFLGLIGFESRVASALDNLPYGGVFAKALGLIPVFLWVWTLVPVWATTVAIIYYERRIRLEGYDIEALAADVWRTDRQTRFEL